jgi:feruloyl esterase
MKLATFLFVASLAHAASCDSLSSLSLPNTTVLLAQDVAVGAFTPPPTPGRAGGGRGPNFTGLPAFCRVQASAKPSSDSDIRIEV